MRRITFTPNEANTLAAHRAFMRRYVFSRSRLLRGYLPGWWVISCVIAGALPGVLAALPIVPGPGQMVAILPVALGAGLALVALFVWQSFAGLLGLVQRNSAQQAMLLVEYTVIWSAGGMEITTPRGTTAPVWSDFFQWAEGPETLMLFQSDRAFNFIPQAACCSADLEDLRRTMADAGVQRA